MQTKKKRRAILSAIMLFCIILVALELIGTGIWYYWYSHIVYKNKVFPAVYSNGIPLGGKTKQEVQDMWLITNNQFNDISLTFDFEEYIATLSGDMIQLGYDATLSATQAYVVGRSPYYLSNLNDRIFKKRIDLTFKIQWNKDAVNATVDQMKKTVNIPAENALFRFSGGKVLSFKPSKNGRAVNEKELQTRIDQALIHLSQGNERHIRIPIPVEPVFPSSATTDVNTFGIKELIGKGYSQFSGSIPGRIHNVSLAAAKLNGLLIKPGEIFSFNQAIGDISAATGYQSAYIIKEGRTVMGDGGGVCQVSTTLFRAALQAGLPVIERHEHSYRVHYYEDGGFKAGLDATVFHPTNDLKIKNDTPAHILIQTYTDPQHLTLTFELFGTSDGRTSEILNHHVWGFTPPPPDLYQDDPTLPKGAIKQVDFAAWGAKASFQYTVTRNGETLINQPFTSNYRPWQAVFLRGTKE